MRAVATERALVRRRDRIWIWSQRRAAVRASPALADEVITTDDFRGREQSIRRRVARIGQCCAPRSCISSGSAGAAERRMCVIDTAVDHGNAHTFARHAQTLQRLGADVWNCFSEVALVIARGRDARHRAIVLQRFDFACIDFQEYRVCDQLHRADDLRAGHGLRDAAKECGLFDQHVGLRRAGAVADGGRVQ